MKFLVTGARAPSSLEFARILGAGGHQVYLLDSVHFPISRFSRWCEKFIFVSPVNPEPERYVRDVRQVIDRFRIDCLIPTCEEIFVLARNRERLGCPLWCDDFNKLEQLHDKYRFTELARNEFAEAPESQRLTSRAEMDRYRGNSQDWVFKPVFSRFAEQTLVSPTEDQLAGIEISVERPWLAQERIHGREYSSFSLADRGKLAAHICYFSRYRAGIGAGIHLESVDHDSVFRFVSRLVSDIRFHGQIGFDFIENPQGKLSVIECNPRATNGWHFLADPPEQIRDRLLKLVHAADERVTSQADLFRPDPGRLKMAGFAMPLWGLASSLRTGRMGSLLPDFFRARDIFFRWNDPLPLLMGAPLGLSEIFWRSLRLRISMQKATTFDLEYDGDPGPATSHE